jgi:hypothetical protein
MNDCNTLNGKSPFRNSCAMLAPTKSTDRRINYRYTGHIFGRMNKATRFNGTMEAITLRQFIVSRSTCY